MVNVRVLTAYFAYNGLAAAFYQENRAASLRSAARGKGFKALWVSCATKTNTAVHDIWTFAVAARHA